MPSRKFISLVIITVLLFSFLPFGTASAYTETPSAEIKSRHYAVFAANSSETLLSSNETTYFYPYSVTKMMTAIIALENADCDINQMPVANEYVTVGREIELKSGEYTNIPFLGEDYVSGGFEVSDRVSLRDLITAMILGNADDAAMTVAIYIGRKTLGGISSGKYYYDKEAYDKFVELMNRKVQLMGLLNTHFDNPSGVYSETTSHTTVKDSVRITSEFLSKPFLRETVEKASIKYWDYEEIIPEEPQETENPGEVLLPEELLGSEEDEAFEEEPPEPEKPTREEKIFDARHSKWESFLPITDEKSEYYLPECKTVVASRTQEGMFVAVKAFKNDVELIIVAMGANEDELYIDIKNLIGYVYENYFLYTYVEKGQLIEQYHVKNAMDVTNNQLRICATQSPAILVRKDRLDQLGNELRIYSNYFVPTKEDLYDKYVQPEATILKGTVVGTMDIYYEAKYKCSVSLYADNTVPVFEELPALKKKSWLEELDYSRIALLFLGCVLVIISIIFLIKIFINLRRPARARRFYLPEDEERRSRERYKRRK